MRQYHDLLAKILDDGNDRGDRTGTGTRSCFGLQFRHNLAEGFPLLTTKKLPFKTIVTELLWFLRGDTNIKYLLENNCHIWSADALRVFNAQHEVMHRIGIPEFEKRILSDEKFARLWGDLGPIYGEQWRAWRGRRDAEHSTSFHTNYFTIDQIENVIKSIKEDPEGRRHIVSAWNPADIKDMALPPCHCLFQFYVYDGKLSCHLYQRSADVFLGVPFNIASYALLTHIVSHQCGLDVGDLVISFGDIHIYNNHRKQVDLQLNREHRPLPKLKLAQTYNTTNGCAVDAYDLEDFILEGYDPHPAIKGELSVGT